MRKVFLVGAQHYCVPARQDLNREAQRRNIAIPTFIHILAQPDIEIAAVITQPDRPSGRGKQISPSPMKKAAIAASVPVHQPEKIRSPEARALLQQLAPDCIVIIAYGQIIPAALLNIPKLGWIN